jgi:potassium-dependent mechanosensitive channel
LLMVRLILLCLGYFLAVAASGVPVDKITIVLGALGVGIGLGLQNIVNNFVSGIILIFDRPLQIGDLVQVGNHTGKVREMGLRSSTLLTAEGAEVIIPNGDILSTQIVNWTLTNNQRRLKMELTIVGTNDIACITTVIRQVVFASEKVEPGREPQILITKVLDDGFSLAISFWIKDVNRTEEVKSDILVALSKEVTKNKLKIS